MIRGVVLLPGQLLRGDVLGVGPPGVHAFLVLELDDGDALAVIGKKAFVRDVARHGAGEFLHLIDQGDVFVANSGLQAGTEDGDNHGGSPCSFGDGLSMPRHLSTGIRRGPASRFWAPRRALRPTTAPSETSSAAAASADRAGAKCRPAPCRTAARLRPASSNRSARRSCRRTLAVAACRCRRWFSGNNWVARSS